MSVTVERETGCDSFIRAIVAAPGDALPRLVFADWLDEHGRHSEALGQRWAAKHGKRPRPDSGYWDDTPDMADIPDESRLPLRFWGIDNLADVDHGEWGISGSNEAERWFLETACTRVRWSDDGEPVAAD